MFNFLVEISKSGSIDQVIWSDPGNVVSNNHYSIFELFSRDARNVLIKAIKKSASRDDAFYCDTPLKLRDQPSSMQLCIASTDRRYLVFGAEEKMPMDGECSKGYQPVILMFMNILKSCINNKASGNSQPQNIQVDMIKTLMNELRHRKRLLEEANVQMNTLNNDLNNRLVKDTLTGLVSRYQYRTEIEYFIGKNPGKLGVFVFIDIDDFKAVNDKYGHATGDQYLVEFSERLKRLPAKDVIIMRISGDEFGLFYYELDDVQAQMMDEIWHKIKHHVLAKPIVANGYSLPITISAGMSVYGADTFEIYELIENADFAMYSAKRKGKNRYAVYDKSRHGR